MGNATMKERVDDESTAVVNQKLEPRLRDARKRRMNVVCINTYPARTSKMSKLSAFWKVVWETPVNR